MQAILIERTGGPEVLNLAEVEAETPGPGELRVRVNAAGVNFVDIYYRTGRYALELPAVIGQEGAGIVTGVGEAVEGFSEGDRVAWAQRMGSYAQSLIIAVDDVVAVPDGIELDVAAAVLLQGMTAHYLVHDTFRLAAGDTAVVHAGGGGVGQLLIQLAKLAGARVLTTVSTEHKAELARQAGADEVIRYTDVDFADEVRQVVPRGVDVVYDSVGQATFDGSLRSLRPRGYLVLFGASSGPVAPVDPQRLNAGGSLFLTRPTLRDYIAGPDELRSRAGDLFALLAEDQLRVRIDQMLPLAQAADAHRYLEQRKTHGKVLLLP